MHPIFFSIVLATPAVQAYTARICGHAIPMEHKPSGYRCQAPFAPTGKYASRARFQTILGGDTLDCNDACFGNNACKAFTYTPETSDASSSCALYSRGAGSQMRLQASSDQTTFSNKHCIYKPTCFTIDTTEALNEASLVGTRVDVALGSHPAFNAFLTHSLSDESPIQRFYFNTKAELVSDGVGYPVAGTYSNDADGNQKSMVQFPSDTTGNQDAVYTTCYRNTDNTIDCQSPGGTVLFSCADDYQYLQITATEDMANAEGCSTITLQANDVNVSPA